MAFSCNWEMIQLCVLLSSSVGLFREYQQIPFLLSLPEVLWQVTLGSFGKLETLPLVQALDQILASNSCLSLSVRIQGVAVLGRWWFSWHNKLTITGCRPCFRNKHPHNPSPAAATARRETAFIPSHQSNNYHMHTNWHEGSCRGNAPTEQASRTNTFLCLYFPIKLRISKINKCALSMK
jgi:hypothetical protein